MLRLLLVAPTCDGEDVGEAWVAHRWADQLSRRHDVTVLTYHKRGSTPAARQLPRARVVEWTEPAVLGRAERLNSLLKPGYLPFFVRARRWIRQAHRRGERFDLGHQVTPVAMRYPTPLLGSGLPYLLGPVGGGLASPPAFAADETGTPWYVDLRRLDAARLRHDRLLRRSYTEAACVLGIAGYVRDTLAGLPLQRFEVLNETALDALPAAPSARSGGGVVRLVHVGRLVRTKGAREAIRAMSLLTDLPVRLDVVGDGFDRPACERLVADLGLGDRVRLHGRLDRAQVDEIYRQGDIFVFPSYREPGGNVVFEAMGHGLPLVVCDRGGPASAVDDTCGFRVPATSPDQVSADVAAAVRRLVVEPDLRARMSAAALQRVTEIGLWTGKVDRADALYRSLIT